MALAARDRQVAYPDSLVFEFAHSRNCWMETEKPLVSRKELGADVGGKIQTLFFGQGPKAVIFRCTHLKGDPSPGVPDDPSSGATKLPADPIELANNAAPFSSLLGGRLPAVGKFVLEGAVVVVEHLLVMLELAFQFRRRLRHGLALRDHTGRILTRLARSA